MNQRNFLKITGLTLMQVWAVIAIIGGVLCSCGGARDYYVSVAGNDLHPGNEHRPFRTIQKAADLMHAGDVCYVGEGIYREAVRLEHSGTQGRPIRFVARKGAHVVVDGTEPIEPKWSPHKGHIYRTPVQHEVRQLFVNGKMLTEARWPNMTFPQGLWSRAKWATSDTHSRHGKMVDAQLAGTGINWSGAIAMLNVSHQFYTWTRPVRSHGKGSDTFTYAADLSDFSWRRGRRWTEQTVFEDDCYYLFGTLAALDCEGEWFYDAVDNMLYMWVPDGCNLSEYEVTFKRRDYGFQAEGIEYVQFTGFDFFGTAIDFESSSHLAMENCHFLYPCHSRRLEEPGYNDDEAYCQIEGQNNTVRTCSFAYGSLTGLEVRGQGNLIENNILHDFSWDASLKHVPLRVIGTDEANSQGNVIRQNTVYNSGGPGIHFKGRDTVVEYNHAYNGLMGRSGGSKDGSIIYTSSPSCAGSVIRYNWVHGAKPPVNSNISWGGGMGIRGDDRTMRLTVHHNVIWDCGGAGIVVKGDYNRVFNNTVLDIGREGKPTGHYIQLTYGQEPMKPRHRKSMDTVPLMQCENAHSEIRNNVALTITSGWKGGAFPENDNVTGNYHGRDVRLMDPANYDFRPKPESQLIDGGQMIKGFTDNYKDKSPDIGAYESNSERWIAGADWKEDRI